MCVCVCVFRLSQLNNCSNQQRCCQRKNTQKNRSNAKYRKRKERNTIQTSGTNQRRITTAESNVRACVLLLFLSSTSSRLCVVVVVVVVVVCCFSCLFSGNERTVERQQSNRQTKDKPRIQSSNNDNNGNRCDTKDIELVQQCQTKVELNICNRGNMYYWSNEYET